MEEIVEAGGKNYKIRELTLEEGMISSAVDDPKQATYEFVSKCLVEPTLSAEEIKKLPFREGLKLVQAVQLLNGLSKDFTKPKEASN